MSTEPNKSWEEKWAEFCEKQADGFDAFTKLQRSGIAGCFEINGKSFIRSTVEEAVQSYQSEDEQRHIASAVEIARREERQRLLGKLKVYSVIAPEESRAATFTVEQLRSVLDKEE